MLPPNSGIKVTMRWADGFSGISESHVLSFISDLSGAAYLAAKQLMTARTAMMGAGIVPISCRMSVLGVFRQYLNLSSADITAMQPGPLKVVTNLNADQIAAGVQPNQDGSADAPDDAVLMDVYANSFQSHARYYLGGIPDIMVRENPTGPWIVGVPSWNTLFQAYATILTTSTPAWGLISRILPNVAGYAPVQAVGVTFDPTNNVAGVIVPTLPGFVVQGSMIQLRLFKMVSKAMINWNGTWQVQSIVATTTPGQSIYYLRNSSGISYLNTLFLGTVQPVGYVFSPYQKATIGKQSARKRGNSGLAPRGRRKVIARLPS